MMPEPGIISFLNRIKSHPEARVNWALREGIAGLLYKELLKSDTLALLDFRWRTELKKHYCQFLQHNLKLIHTCRQFLAAANEKKIKTVLIQGISLIQDCYPDIGTRPMADIDLWVRRKDLAAVKKILSDQEFSPPPDYPLTFRKNSISFDLHTHILWADRITARNGLIDIDQNVIFERARPLAFEGQPAYGLDPYDQIVYLGLHLLKHNAERAIWLIDIQRLVESWNDMQWQMLMDRANQLGQTKCLLYVCFLLQQSLGMRFPFEITQKVKRLNGLEKKILRQKAFKGALPRWSTLLLFSAGKGIQKGFPFVFETLFPRPDILRQVFPDSAGLSRRRLYTKRFRQLLHMLRSV